MISLEPTRVLIFMNSWSKIYLLLSPAENPLSVEVGETAGSAFIAPFDHSLFSPLLSFWARRGEVGGGFTAACRVRLLLMIGFAT